MSEDSNFEAGLYDDDVCGTLSVGLKCLPSLLIGINIVFIGERALFKIFASYWLVSKI